MGPTMLAPWTLLSGILVCIVKVLYVGNGIAPLAPINHGNVVLVFQKSSNLVMIWIRATKEIVLWCVRSSSDSYEGWVDRYLCVEMTKDSSVSCLFMCTISANWHAPKSTRTMHHYTIDYRYIAIIYNTMSYTEQQLQWGRFMGCLSWDLHWKTTAIYRGRTVFRATALPHFVLCQ